MQNYEESLRGIDMNRKNFFFRHFKLSTLYFMQNCGEHYIAMRQALAMAHNTKLIDAEGNEISL